MSVFTSFAGTLQADLILAGDPSIQNISALLANTEYTVTIPAGTRQYIIKIRSGSKFNIAYILGNSGTAYFEVPKNCFYGESDIKLTAAKDLYFQTPLPGQILEVLLWT
jgi:hypothetical protein